MGQHGDDEGTLADAVNELKTQPGGDIIAFGGVRFASALIDEGLVDEFQFFINPSALEDGSSVGKKAMKLKLAQCNFYECAPFDLDSCQFRDSRALDKEKNASH